MKEDDDGFRMNEVLVLWYIMGLWPLVYNVVNTWSMCKLAPDECSLIAVEAGLSCFDNFNYS